MQFRGNPDAEYGNVQTHYSNRNSDLESLCSLSVHHQDRYAVNDDLEQTMHLDYPETQNGEQGVYAVLISCDTTDQLDCVLLQR